MFPEASALTFCDETKTVSGEVRGINCVHERSGEDVRTIADIIETTAGISSITLKEGKITSVALENGACPTEISNRSNMGIRIIEALAGTRIPGLVSQDN
ncbi:hypothetical protein KBB89_02280 [Candidatus Gracilibacteria bacterium]|nr:hypothetical protein [Candidatus Gracilibacteria bacterium]